MKGVFPQEELNHLPTGFSVSHHELSVPNLQAERWLIKATKI
jgi:hypothetical protein